MTIYIASGIGTGPTKLSAFDSALNDIGVCNYNLLHLSSVIPPQAKVHSLDGPVPPNSLPGQWGDRLYVVMAEKRVDTPNTEAWAGLGWVQDAKTGRGLFVEHIGESEQTVRNDIVQTLEAMMATRNEDLGEIHMKVVGRMCTHHPVCAMVVASYQVSDWDNGVHHIGA